MKLLIKKIGTYSKVSIMELNILLFPIKKFAMICIIKVFIKRGYKIKPNTKSGFINKLQPIKEKNIISKDIENS